MLRKEIFRFLRFPDALFGPIAAACKSKGYSYHITVDDKCSALLCLLFMATQHSLQRRPVGIVFRKRLASCTLAAYCHCSFNWPIMNGLSFGQYKLYSRDMYFLNLTPSLSEGLLQKKNWSVFWFIQEPGFWIICTSSSFCVSQAAVAVYTETAVHHYRGETHCYGTRWCSSFCSLLQLHCQEHSLFLFIAHASVLPHIAASLETYLSERLRRYFLRPFTKVSELWHGTGYLPASATATSTLTTSHASSSCSLYSRVSLASSSSLRATTSIYIPLLVLNFAYPVRQSFW